MSTAATPYESQTKRDRKRLLNNLPVGTRRVRILNAQGKQQYKRPEDVDVDRDIIPLNKNGVPIVMRKKPGAPVKTRSQLNPLSSQIGQVMDARDEWISTNDLLSQAMDDASGDPFLDLVLVNMIAEAVNIEFERVELQRHGQGSDAADLSTKRARVLKAIADLVLNRRKIADGALIDLDSPVFKALFTLLLETFREAMATGGCRSEQIEQTFTHMVSSLDGDSWKGEARARMKDALK